MIIIPLSRPHLIWMHSYLISASDRVCMYVCICAHISSRPIEMNV